MKTLFLLIAVAAAWWYYKRQHLQTAVPPAPQAVDNAATRYAGSLANDEKKAADAVQKMNGAIGQAEQAYGDAVKQQ